MTQRKDGTPRWLVLLAFCAITTGLAAAAAWLRWRFTRYEVEGASMQPALQPGDFVVADRRAFRGGPPCPGDAVLVRDPREPSRELVKRVVRVDPELGLWIEGDNRDASTDSRTFGWVSLPEIVGLVRWRYWPANSIGMIPAAPPAS